MANSLQTIDSGKAELKDYYDNYDSTYEALRRRRKRAAEKDNIESQVNDDFSKVPDPER